MIALFEALDAYVKANADPLHFLIILVSALMYWRHESQNRQQNVGLIVHVSNLAQITGQHGERLDRVEELLLTPNADPSGPRFVVQEHTGEVLNVG